MVSPTAPYSHTEQHNGTGNWRSRLPRIHLIDLSLDGLTFSLSSVAGTSVLGLGSQLDSGLDLEQML